MANTKNLKLKISAETKQAGDNVKSFNSSIKKIGDSARKAGALLLAGFASRKLFDGFKQLISLASEQERVLSQMDAVLTSTGQAVGLTKKEIVGLSQELQKSTGFGDELIQSGQNMLLTFTNLKEDVFKDTTKILLDMTVAMNNGVVTQEGMKNQAIQLGKALNNPIEGISALTRVGVKFTDAQKESIRTLVESGRTMDAQKIILAELNTEFGGSAAAIGQTFKGSINAAHSSLADLGEVIGAKMLPALNVLAKGFTSVTEKAIEFFTNTKRLNKEYSEELSELGRVALDNLIQMKEEEILKEEEKLEKTFFLNKGNQESIIELKRQELARLKAASDIIVENEKVALAKIKSAKDEADIASQVALDTALESHGFFTASVISNTKDRLSEEIRVINEILKTENLSTNDRMSLEKKLFKLKIDNKKEEIKLREASNKELLSDSEAVGRALVDNEKSVGKVIGEIIKRRIIKQINLFALAEIGKATAAAPMTFGATLAAIAPIIAAQVGAIAAVSAIKFQHGGIVPGGTTSGDQQVIRANSGEMILNREQQSNLFKLVNGGGGNSGGGGVTINFNGGVFMGDRRQAKEMAKMIDVELVTLGRQRQRVSA